MQNSFLAAALLLVASLGSSIRVLAAPSAGCGKAPPSIKPNINSTITVGGKTREFILKLPDNYDSKHPYRLIFTFHWLYGTATMVAEGSGGAAPYYGLAALANSSAIFVSPNGQAEPESSRFPGAMGWINTDGEDVRFVDALLDTLLNDLCVDTNLIFSTGFSYGAAISYALACARAKVFRAVGIMSGGTMSGCEGGTPRDPIAYYEQHGTQDHVLNITMARSMRDAMVQNNGCKAVSPEPTAPAGKHTEVVYEGCNPKYPLTWTVFDGDHTPSPKDTGSNSTFSPEYIWKFFSQFS